MHPQFHALRGYKVSGTSFALPHRGLVGLIGCPETAYQQVPRREAGTDCWPTLLLNGAVRPIESDISDLGATDDYSKQG